MRRPKPTPSWLGDRSANRKNKSNPDSLLKRLSRRRQAEAATEAIAALVDLIERAGNAETVES
jgi:hypothetical protein